MTPADEKNIREVASTLHNSNPHTYETAEDAMISGGSEWDVSVGQAEALFYLGMLSTEDERIERARVIKMAEYMQRVHDFDDMFRDPR